MDKLRAIKYFLKVSETGILRVTANPGYGRFRLMPTLRKLRKLYPDIVIDVELTDRLVNLSQNPVI